MTREDYKIFSEAAIGTLTLPNRLVRSATWDPSLFTEHKMTDAVLQLYAELARGGVGLIITGGFPVIEGEMLNEETPSYERIEVQGLDRLVAAVHRSGNGCKVVAQLETGALDAMPSTIPSPFGEEPPRALSLHEIRKIVDCFVAAIVRMHALGFDGAQLHAAHGGLLSRFLSPYTNRRTDAYGGSVGNRARIVREILSAAREKVGSFPILIKVNCTDYVEGGTDIETFPELAAEIAGLGVDAMEISGGMWECMVRSEEELGFPPSPAPESHTHLQRPESQSYFLPWAERVHLDIPVILVGGNRDIERLETLVRRGTVDFVALCRPLICEPDLPERWRKGQDDPTPACISCNACIYHLIIHPGRETPDVVTCLFKKDPQAYSQAQVWLTSWVKENISTQER